MTVERASGVQSVVRAFAALEAMGDRGGQASLSELAAELGLAMPTVHRLLRTLVDLGYVRQLPSRHYALGPGLMRLGDQATRMIAAWARPALEGLESSAHETANLAALEAGMVVYVAQVPSRHQMRMFTEVGRRVHAHSTGVGKALLATIPDDQVSAIVRSIGMPRFTSSTIVTEADLLAELDVIRQRGYAIDEGEQEVGVRCFAMAIAGTHPAMGISVSGPSTRVTLSSADWMVPALRETAGRLKAQLVASDPAR
ncbi:IclR family transcriptional regulator [Microbacterium sp. LWS13-1.2]|uniref:Glycerol operon regulatory protein n=1 Tax=Microbacterium sp. LWS13-1.2 TaxID=3135264 RepID=A0AAU6SAS0_9MICO